MHIVPDKKEVTKLALGYIVLTVIFLIAALFIRLIPTDNELKLLRTVFLAVDFGLIGIIWLIGFPLRLLYLKGLSYYIEPACISIHKGILTKTQQNIPYQKITDFKLVRSPFDRILGIASIQIQTAGQSTVPYEGVLRGLTQCENLLANLRSRLKKLRGDMETPDLPTPEEALSAEKDILQAILGELKAIRNILENK